MSAKGKAENSPLVLKGLAEITERVNPETRLTNKLDKNDATLILIYLHEAGERLDPEAIRVWAVRDGWKPEDARALANRARQVRDGARLSVDRKRIAPKIIDEFRTKIKEEANGDS